MILTSVIKKHISQQFFNILGRPPHLDNPKTFNEKLQWLKLYYHHPLQTICADKYKAREYVSNKVRSQYLIPLLGVYDNENQIDFDKLPSKFILKTNQGSGYNIVCHDKDKLDIVTTKNKLHTWLLPQSNHYFHAYEWGYKNIKPKIICEQLLEDKKDLIEYQFYCFHGQPKLLVVVSERKILAKVDYFNLNWQRLPIRKISPNSKNGVTKPADFDKMVNLAKRLAHDFPFVRVDMYYVNHKIYTGELTFFPNAGYGTFNPIMWDYKFGDLINLKAVKKTSWILNYVNY